MYSNDFDKLSIVLPERCYELKGSKSGIGLGYYYYKKKNGELLLDLSGKITSNSAYLGGILCNNYNIALEKLCKDANIIINETDFLENTTVRAVHVKKDISVDADFRSYISTFKELANANKSLKNQVQTYIRGESMKIIPSTKTGSDCFSIYPKLREMRDQRYKNSRYREYYEQFFPEFLEKCGNILRFERQISKFAPIRKAFKIKHKGKICVQELLQSNVDVVQEYINYIGGEFNENEC